MPDISSYKISTGIINEIEKLDSFSDITLPYDFSETVQISSLALLKMLRHGKAGIPIEVMGLIIGEYTDSVPSIAVSDVFAMPQTGTGVSVEAIDPAFQTKMLDMLQQIDILDTIVGWYHSHPGFGCWLSGVDINTQQSFEQLNQKAIAIVIDPVQSVKGKIIIEAFRLYPIYIRGQEIREITCIRGLVNNSQTVKDDHGLNKYYYSLNIVFKINMIERSTFSLMYEKNWDAQFSESEFNNKFNKKAYIDVIREIILLVKKIYVDEKIIPFKHLAKEFPKKILIITKLKKRLLKIVDKTILFCIKHIITAKTNIY
nr:26S proteasome regulatory subunit [Cryptomonas sp.]